jgi:hypothetical protein
MKRTCFLLAAGLMCHAAVLAQNIAQQAQSLGQPAGPAGGGRGGRGISVPIPRPDTGKPFSATVTTQTTQVFVDGTRVSQTMTVMEYRDAEGRVRTETRGDGSSSAEPVKRISIRDPVAGMTYILEPAIKTATKLAMGGGPLGGGRGGRGGETGSNSDIQARLLQQIEALRAATAAGGVPAPNQTPAGNPNDIVEDLGTMTVNGVPARGTRTTTVVPVGAIGNDREFRSVSERWFSPDLNLLVKSMSTDPRFGTTTYELTNISRQPPDASLFQVPGDYNIVTNGMR